VTLERRPGRAARISEALEAHDLRSRRGRLLECGQANLKAMELLDAGNTGTYGHPVPTEVPLGHPSRARPSWFPAMT
jgi:hydroxylamine reductase (hybrid-cluster protein)